jgi:hypothetical protein
MGKDIVLPLVRQINQRLQACNVHDPDQLRDVIAILYSGLATFSASVLQDYDRFPEHALRDAALRRADHVGSAGLVIDEAQPLLDGAVLLRAVEQIALQFDRAIEGDEDGDLELAWRTSDGQHYVVPRVTPLENIDGKRFTRRALIAHRVIPAVADGLTVRLHRSLAVAGAGAAQQRREGSRPRYGAAFFPELLATLSPGDGDFTIASVSGFDGPAMIADQVRLSRGDACLAIVWAELTMSEDSLAAVRSELSDQALDDGISPDFVVAGSWHQTVGGHRRNVSHVLDGGGSDIFQVFKWAKFKLGGRVEAIEPGSEIPILVTESELTVMAICRDFLLLDKEPPYCMINADIAIVPSMAPSESEAVTMAGHEATAKTMSIRFGTQTLVVSQPPSPEQGSTGHVLVFPGQPTDGGAAKVPNVTKVTQNWQACTFAAVKSGTTS